MISSVGSYDVTAFNADRSNTALVAIGWPISRLEPWRMTSSGCSLAIAARTACSTSLASRTFRVSTPSVSRLPHDLLKWPGLSQPSGFQTILLKAWLRGTRVSFNEGQRGRASTGWVAARESRRHPLSQPAGRGVGRPRLGSRPTLSLRPLSKHYTHNSSYIELYL